MKTELLDELQFYEKSIKSISKKVKKGTNVSALQKKLIFEDTDDATWDITITNIRIPKSAYMTEPLYIRHNFEKSLRYLKKQLTCPFDFPCVVVYHIYPRKRRMRPIQYWESIDTIERVLWYDKMLIKGIYIHKINDIIGVKDTIRMKIYDLTKEDK